MIKENDIIMIKAGTGSGKSVLSPILALDYLKYNKRKKIILTMPKRILTKSAAEWAARRLDLMMGQEIGFKYHGSEKDLKKGIYEYKGRKVKIDNDMAGSNNKTIILYSTHGIVLQQFKNARFAINEKGKQIFDILIMDEVHERNKEVDLLLYLFKYALSKNKKIKLILLSATVNHKIYEDYYKDFCKFSTYEIPVESNKPITEYYITDETFNRKDYIKKAIEIIKKIIIDEEKLEKKLSNEKNGILLFVSSGPKKICIKLEKEIKFKNHKIFFAPLEGSSSLIEQEYAISQNKYVSKYGGPYHRKIVVSTNVAESSITVKGLSYVLDSGFEYSVSYSNFYLRTELVEKSITKAQAKQRKGRVGRLYEGYCYKLYNKKDYMDMEDYPIPEIHKSNSIDFIFDAIDILNNEKKIEKKLNKSKLVQKLTKGELITKLTRKNELLLQPFSNISILTGINILIKTDILNNSGNLTKCYELTKIVIEHLSSKGIIGLDCFHAKLILDSFLYDCTYEIIIIIVMLIKFKSIKNLLNFDINKAGKNIMEKFNEFKKILGKNYNSDHIFLYQTYIYYKNTVAPKSKLNIFEEIIDNKQKGFYNNIINLSKIREIYELIDGNETSSYAHSSFMSRLTHGISRSYSNYNLGFNKRLIDIDILKKIVNTAFRSDKKVYKFIFDNLTYEQKFNLDKAKKINKKFYKKLKENVECRTQ